MLEHAVRSHNAALPQALGMRATVVNVHLAVNLSNGKKRKYHDIFLQTHTQEKKETTELSSFLPSLHYVPQQQ